MAVCPHCQKKVNDKVRICPHCAGEIAIKITKTVPYCPRCYCLLEQDVYRGSEIDICPQCKGLWLDSTEFAFHTSERDTYSDPSIPRSHIKKAIKTTKDYLRCVRCDTLMNRRHFRKISGVVIDVCRDHGAWLDSGELEQIRSFIANGGLDKSQDKEITANRERIVQTAREVKDLNTLFRTLNKFDLKRIFLQRF